LRFKKFLFFGFQEELIRARSNECTSVGSQNGYFQGRNVLNQLRVSLNRSLILTPTDNDSDEEVVNVDQDDVRELCQHLDKLHSSEESIRDTSVNRDSIHFYSMEESCEADLMSSESEIEEISMVKPWNELPDKDNDASEDNFVSAFNTLTAVDHASRKSISISSCCQSPILQDPPLSESPKIGNIQRKSMNMSSHLASHNSVSESSKFNLDVLRQSLKQSENIRSSLRSSKTCTGPTETLAASLHRGLQIIDYHQRSSAPNKSSVSFSFEHLTLKPCSEVDKANASSIQTIPEEKPSLNGPSASFLCASCRQRISEKENDAQDSLKTWVLAVNEAENPTQVPKV
jgi:kinesin family protein 15